MEEAESRKEVHMNLNDDVLYTCKEERKREIAYRSDPTRRRLDLLRAGQAARARAVDALIEFESKQIKK